jgi:hypothetical protein
MLGCDLQLRCNAAVMVPGFFTLHVQVFFFLFCQRAPPGQGLQLKVGFCLFTRHGVFFAFFPSSNFLPEALLCGHERVRLDCHGLATVLCDRNKIAGTVNIINHREETFKLAGRYEGVEKVLLSHAIAVKVLPQARGK